MLKKNACLEKENRHGSNILFCFKKLGASKEEKKERDLYFYHFRATSPDHARFVEQNLKI